MDTHIPRQPQPADPRRPYAPPRLSVHGTAQELTHDTAGQAGDFSGAPDAR
jgi:hypothetical protein